MHLSPEGRLPRLQLRRFVEVRTPGRRPSGGLKPQSRRRGGGSARPGTVLQPARRLRLIDQSADLNPIPSCSAYRDCGQKHDLGDRMTAMLTSDSRLQKNRPVSYQGQCCDSCSERPAERRPHALARGQPLVPASRVRSLESAPEPVSLAVDVEPHIQRPHPTLNSFRTRSLMTATPDGTTDVVLPGPGP